MIPQHPDWSSRTDIQPYPQSSFQRPEALPVAVQFVALGPNLLNDSRGSINNRYWVVSQEAGEVVIRGASQ